MTQCRTSNSDGLTVESTSVTVATTASGLSAEVVEAESTEIVKSDTSAPYVDGVITSMQENPGEAVASGVPPTHNLESPAYTPPTVNLQLNDDSQTVESVKSDESLQLINTLQSVSISQSPENGQQGVSLPDIESVPPTNSSSIYTETYILQQPQVDPQYTYPLTYGYSDATIQSQLVPNPQDYSYQQSQTAGSTQTPQETPPSSTPQGFAYAQNNTYHQPIFSPSQTVENPQSSPPSQGPAVSQYVTYLETQLAPSSQNLLSGPLSQEPPQVSVYSQNSTYQQSPTFQHLQPAPASQSFQTPQSGPPFQEATYSQNSTYQQSTVCQDLPLAASPRTSQNPPHDSSSQEYVGHQSSTDQEPCFDPQTPDGSISYTQAQSKEYNGNIYSQSTSPTTTADYSQLADNGNSSLLVSGSDQSCIGAALDDDGADEAGDGGVGFAASVEDGGFPDISINPAAVVNAGAGIANSTATVMKAGANLAQSTFNAVSRINSVAMINAGVGVANSAVDAISGDPLVAVQTGVAVAMSGVRIAASIGSWNEARQRRKDSAAQFAAVHGPADPAVNSKVAIAAQLDEILLVLSVLGQRLVVLEVINLIELPQALVACRTACAQADSGDLLAHFDTLDGTLQYTVTAALFFCAACFPMHIYRGFGTGVLDSFLWGCPHPQYATGQVAGFKSVDRMIAFLKSTPREVQLLTRIPTALSRIVPSFEKNERNGRRRLMNAYKEFVKEIESKGHPQPRDRSFRVVTWHIPFATWNSPFTFKNSGHYYEDFLRWQMDAGRLLHAWTIGGHLDLMNGEMMWLPAGVAESLAGWLYGLPGTNFKLVPSSAFDYTHLKLSPATRKIMLEEGFETVKAVRDPQADFRMPAIPKNIFVPAPPPIRKLVEVPVPQQPILPNNLIGTPVFPQPGTNGGSQVQGANAVSRPIANQQIIHPQTTRQSGTQRSVASHDPPLSFIDNQPAAFQGRSPVSVVNSQPVAAYPPVSHNARPDLMSHHTDPQMTYHHPQGTSSWASQKMAQSTGSHAMGIRRHQQRAPSMPNVLSPNPHGQPVDPSMNLVALVPQPVLQHHQHPVMTQGFVSGVQGMPSDMNQPQNQHPTASTASSSTHGSQHPQNHSSDPAAAAAASQSPYSTRFSTIQPQSIATGPTQTQRLPRKPTNSSRLSSAPNPTPTYSQPLSSNHANHLSDSHSPRSSISRASKISSNHSSLSSSGLPIQLLASPITSPQSPYNIPAPPSAQSQHHPQSQYPFPNQAAIVIKRRAVPPPPPIHPPALRQVKAVHDFAPEQGNELGFKSGDVLDVLDDSSEDGWWEARMHGRVGAIPASYVGDI